MDWSEILDRLFFPGAQYVDIFVEKVRQSSITLEENRLEKVVAGEEEGAGLRVVADDRTFFAHTNDLSWSGVEEMAQELTAQARGKGDPIPVKPGEAAALPGPPPVSHEMTRKTELVKLANETARGYHPSIKQVLVILREKEQELTILSPDREARGTRYGTVMAVQVVAAENSRLERGYEVDGLSRPSGYMDEAYVEELALKAAVRAVKVLKADPAPAGEMPVVLSAEAGGTMIHEAIGHGLENDLAGQGFSVYSGKVGEKVASPLITVVDDPTIPEKRGSYAFDDEGIPARRNVLVEEGRLVRFISDILSSFRYGGSMTGNGRRQSFRHPPIPRMSNTLIAPGQADPQEIIRDTDRGLLVTKMGGGQVNTVNGDFVFEVSEGYRLEKGRKGPPVRGALLIGNGPAILKEIDAVGRDLGYGVGTCGKEGQGVPVADAQPTLRIPRMVVGGRLSPE